MESLQNVIRNTYQQNLYEYKYCGGLNTAIIGSFQCDFERDDELGNVVEDKIGEFHSKYNLTVLIRTNDSGYIPHVHIVDSGTLGGYFDACVMLEKNCYFDHGHHTSKLNTKQRRAFYEFMKSTHRSKKFNGTNFDYAILVWNENNSGVEVGEDTQIPDFRTISGYKEY